MKHVKMNRVLIPVAAAAGLGMCSQETRAGTLHIIHSIPFPTSAPTGLAYGADLAWDGEHLWATIQEVNTGAVTYELEPSEGSVISSSRAPGYSHTGHAWDGTKMWITTNPGMDIPDQVFKWAPGSSLSVSFFAPNSPDAHLTGAAWDGSHLWLADSAYGNQRIMQVDPLNMDVLNSFSPPFSAPRGLTWDGSSLWCLSPASRSVYQMDTSGNVLTTWAVPDVVGYANPYGLTFDGENFWVLANGSQDIVPFPAQIYQLAIPEPSALTLVAIAGAVLLVLIPRRRKTTGKGERGQSADFSVYLPGGAICWGCARPVAVASAGAISLVAPRWGCQTPPQGRFAIFLVDSPEDRLTASVVSANREGYLVRVDCRSRFRHISAGAF